MVELVPTSNFFQGPETAWWTALRPMEPVSWPRSGATGARPAQAAKKLQVVPVVAKSGARGEPADRVRGPAGAREVGSAGWQAACLACQHASLPLVRDRVTAPLDSSNASPRVP